MRDFLNAVLRFRVVFVAAAVATLVFGIADLRNRPVDVFPEFAPPMVEVQTEALGLSANEVEDLITMNLEELLSGVPWLQTVRSRSVPGVSSIILIFEPGTDIMRARQLVQERLTLAYTLPNVSKAPQMIQPLSATSRAMMVGFSSDELSLMELSVIARWTIKPKLLGVPGVANVAIWGDRDRQLQVLIDPERLRNNGLTQDQIIATAGNALWFSPLTFLEAAVPGTGGWIDSPNQRLEVRHVLPISNPEDLAQVTIEGTSMQLGDVTDIVEGYPPLIGDALLDDGPGLVAVIEKLPGANTIEVTRGIEEALASLQTGLPSIEMDATVFRSANFVEMALQNIGMALLIGGILVVLVVGAMLANWRAALIAVVTIPLSVVAALVVMRGATLNTMVVAGLVIALAAVIDDAIVSVARMMRRIREPNGNRTDESFGARVLDATVEMRGSMMYATLILALVVLPMFFIGGLSGAFLRPLAVTFVVALASGMVVALLVTPALGYFLLKPGSVGSGDGPLVGALRGVYEGLLSLTTGAPRTALVTGVVLAVVGIGAWVSLDQTLLPQFRTNYLLVDWAGAPGTSHPEMFRVMQRAAAEVRTIPGVDYAHAHVGRAITGDQIVGMHAGQLWLRVSDDADYEETLASIRETVTGYPGLVGEVQTYLGRSVREVLAGAGESIVVRLYGDERDVLAELSEEVRQAMAAIDGIVDLRVEGQLEQPQVEIRVDLARAEPYGVKPGDVRRAAATMFAGLEVGFLFEDQKVFNVVVWGAPEARNSVSDIENLLINAPRGGHVRLGDVADVRVVPVPTVIHHEDISPRVDVVANVEGRGVNEVAEEVETALDGMEFPLEYYPELLGEYAEREAAQARLTTIGIAVAIGIFLLIQSAIRSWTLAAVFFVSLPVSLAGCALAVLIFGGTLSLGSLIGFTAALAFSVRTGIALMKHYQHLQQTEAMEFGRELVERGTRESFGPIITTALTVAAIMLPFALLGNVAGLEFIRPIAIVTLGGLVTSLVFTLHLVPAMYLAFGDGVEPEDGDLHLVAVHRKYAERDSTTVPGAV